MAKVTDRYWVGLQMLAQQPGPWSLPGPALRILFFIAADLDTEEYRTIKQTRVARALDLNQQSVSRAMAALVAENYLEQGPADGASKTYRLNRRISPIQALYAA